MASGGGVTETESDANVFEEEGRVESTDLKESKKSRKFKPFEAVRKLFKGNKKRTKSKDDNQISVRSVKAKSTTALTRTGGQDDDDEDSDGGFKSHQPSKTLQGGKRSISEDSVFNPGDRTTADASLTALKTVAVSEENIHKNAFQNELFSKLKKRHSQYSDEDDGLPQSPVPPVTTADIIMGDSLKPHPGKSSSRESEKSLISVDSSDNEADDPFIARWSSPVKPRSRSSDQSPPPDKTVTMDFEAVKSTQALSNEAAKHKLAIKPSRKVKRKNRETNPPPTALPSLNEESPTKLQTDDNVFTEEDTIDTGVLKVSAKQGSSEKPIVSMTTPAGKSSLISPKATPEVKETVAKAAALPPKSIDSIKPSGANLSGSLKVEAKKDLPSLTPSKLESDTTRVRSVSLKEESSTAKSSELSQAFDKRNRRTLVEPADLSSVKSDSLKTSESAKSKVSEQKTVGEAKTDSMDKSKQGVQKSVEVKSSKPEETKPVKKIEESKPFVKKGEEAKPKPAEEIKPSSSVEVVEKATEKEQSKSVSDVKPTVTKQPSDDKPETDSSSVNPESFKKDVAFKVSPPKEDYKLKRQSRSKTLPEQPQLPEDFAANVQRTKSQRAEVSPIASKVSPQRQTVYIPKPAVSRPEIKRTSFRETTSASSEPDWMAAIRKKKAEAENKGQGQEVKKDVMSTSAKEIVVKETEKPADKMSKSFTASSTSSTIFDSSAKAEHKKEAFTFNTRSTSVKAPTSTETKTESAPKPFGSMKSPTKSINIVTSSTTAKSVASSDATTSLSTATSKLLSSTTSSSAATNKNLTATTSSSTATTKPLSATTSSSATSKPPSAITPSSTATTKPLTATTSSSSATTKPLASTTATNKAFSSTTSSMSKPFTSATSSTKPESIKTFGSNFKEPQKDSKTSPTEEAKKVFSRGQSVKVTTSSTEPTSSPVRTASVKAPSSVRPSVGKGSVQSTDSSGEKSQKDSAVPAWKSGVKPMKIEIIEKEPKQEVVMRKASVKKTAPTPAPDSDTCRDTSTNRSSKVLDMVKSFQKLQVS